MCVTLGVIGILLDLFSIFAGGARDHASLALTKTLALVCDIDLGRQIDVPAGRETYVEHKLSTSLFPSVKGYCSGDAFGFSARTSSPGRPLDRCFLLELLAT